MRLLLAALAALLLLPTAAQAAPTLDEVGSFKSPVYVTAPPGDARLFVVERGGTIRIVGKNGKVKPGPFADLSAQTTTDGERGLLSIAFPPDYAASGLAYAYLTAPDGAIQIRELRRSASDPNRAEPGAGRLVIEQPHGTNSNHNGGQVRFGPDGLLYFGIGDGGSGNDPDQNGQKRSTLLGKLLRIDPRQTATAAYTVPADNPFVGEAGARPEIWAYGLRNPFRFSFDAGTGDLWIGDVGQGAREEVDLGPRAGGGARGANFGWRCFEGKIRTPGVPACEAPGHQPPLFDFDHSADGVCSITGGVVVRDRGLPSLAGRYLYGDLCDAALRSAGTDGTPGGRAGLSVSQLVAVSEDACGRVYTVSIEGPVSRVRDGAGTACDVPEPTVAQAPVSTPPAEADRTPCRIAVRRSARQRAARIRAAVTTSEPCTVRVSLGVKGVATVYSAGRTLAAGKRSTLKVSIRSRAGRKVVRAVRRHSRAAIFTITARDAAGNRARVTRRVRLVR